MPNMLTAFIRTLRFKVRPESYGDPRIRVQVCNFSAQGRIGCCADGSMTTGGNSVKAVVVTCWNALALLLCLVPAVAISQGAVAPSTDECTLAANKLANHPSPDAVDTLLRDLLGHCQDRLFRGLSHVFDQESREPYWAKPLEAKIETAAQAFDDLEIKGGCHRSLCRYVAHFAHRDSQVATRQNFSRRLYASVTDTLLDVASVYDATDPGANGGLVIYFYSRRKDAEFVQPLTRALTRTAASPPG
jgi:hypothetical protein